MGGVGEEGGVVSEQQSACMYVVVAGGADKRIVACPRFYLRPATLSTRHQSKAAGAIDDRSVPLLRSDEASAKVDTGPDRARQGLYDLGCLVITRKSKLDARWADGWS